MFISAFYRDPVPRVDLVHRLRDCSTAESRVSVQGALGACRFDGGDEWKGRRLNVLQTQVPGPVLPL